jgi:pimeloyl-ACP methyl ester carboxylesterase
VIVWLRHAKVRLALHPLRPADSGRALLLLHGLGERTPERLPKALEPWRGPVWGLDFTGHGASTLPRAGGYFAEVLMADADAGLAHLGEATLLGRGLGAYVALLLAGGRPRLVRGALLCDGPGLAGGGDAPGSASLVVPYPGTPPPDPFALAELSRDLRPPDYAAAFARQATRLSGLETPLTVCATERPGWLRAVVEARGVRVSSLEQALARYAGLLPPG